MRIAERFFYRSFERLRVLLPKRYLVRWALPAAVSMLLAYGQPFNNALYYGSGAPRLPVAALAFLCACRCSLGLQSFFAALLGLFTGSAAAGMYSGCVASALLFALELALGALRGKRAVRPIMRYAALFAAEALLLPLCAVLGLMKTPSASGFFEYIAICSLSVSLAFFLACGLSALSPNKRPQEGAYEVRLLSLALLGGFISASFGYSRVFGIGLGAASAALFCLMSARRSGLSAIACAAVIACARVFSLGGDLMLIAVLCVCSLCAVFPRALGKWGVLLGFSVPSVALFYFLNGAGAISPAELLLGGSAFLIADIGPILAPNELAAKQSEREKTLENELIRRSERLSMLSAVLFEMAGLFNGADGGAAGFINSQLSGVAKSLAILALPEGKGRESFEVGFGSAQSPGRGGGQTGDTSCVREMDGVSLAAISDGMGMGEAARRESEQTVNMVADLVYCGFDIDSAAELVNRLLLLREGGEMYATLDAMLFDRRKGSVIAAKHGAPASYIVRRGKLSALSAEALPVGIVEEAKTAVFSVSVKRGDVIIMMSDGVSDALGDALFGALKTAAAASDPSFAARELIERARSLGGDDDMTAIIARVS